MYKEHPVFRQPSKESAKVWRYMDFTKFVSLLESKSLYFTRADKFEDPFEGSYPRINVLSRQQIPDDLPHELKKMYLDSLNSLKEKDDKWPKYTAINSWHLNDHESAAMWSLYLKSNEGIAIQSTFQRLRDSFFNAESDIFLGQVKYIDYETEYISNENLLEPFVHKRMSFEHEKEVRAIVIKWPIVKGVGLDFSIETIVNGLNIAIDLNVLIERIYIAPDAEAWFAELVRSVVKRYGYNYEIIQSNLNQKPLY